MKICLVRRSTLIWEFILFIKFYSPHWYGFFLLTEVACTQPPCQYSSKCSMELFLPFDIPFQFSYLYILINSSCAKLQLQLINAFIDRDSTIMRNCWSVINKFLGGGARFINKGDLVLSTNSQIIYKPFSSFIQARVSQNQMRAFKLLLNMCWHPGGTEVQWVVNRE